MFFNGDLVNGRGFWVVNDLLGWVLKFLVGGVCIDFFVLNCEVVRGIVWLRVGGVRSFRYGGSCFFYYGVVRLG